MARILYYNRLINEPFGGGTHARGLYAAFSALGHSVQAFPAAHAYPLVDSLVGRYSWLPESIRVPGLDVRARLRSALERSALLRVLKTFQPDVIVARRAAYDYTLDWLCFAARLPVVAEVNAVITYEAHRHSGERFLPWEIRRERTFVSRATRVVCVSEAVADQVRASGAEAVDLRVVHNGVDETEIDPNVAPAAPAAAFAKRWTGVVGYCGTLSANHDPTVLRMSASDIARRRHDIGFVFVGPTENELRAAGFNACVLERSLVTGKIPHLAVAAHLVVADVLWAAIRNDHGSPLKLFEYLCLARPVVMTGGAQIREILSASGGGIALERGDAEGMSVEVLRLVDDDSRRAAMGAAGRAWVIAHATWKDVASRMIEGLLSESEQWA